MAVYTGWQTPNRGLMGGLRIHVIIFMYSRCKIGSLKNGIWDLMGFKQVGLESTTLLKKTERELEVFKNSPKVRLV